MRRGVDRNSVLVFMEEIGKAAKGPGKVYLVGGATALLLGLRDQTIDIDIKLDPEPRAIFESIADLKERLSINVELASPDQFIPELPGWRERSLFVSKCGPVEFYHYDLYAQALAKIQRGHRSDLADARAFVKLGKVEPATLHKLFDQIKPNLIRYPSIDPEVFEQRVNTFIKESLE